MASCKRPLIIGVSGFGGAGKSSFSNELGKPLDAPVISVDSFMKDRTLQEYSLWEVME
jgi:uridine kinase